MFFKKKLANYISIFFILSLWFCIDTNFENIVLLKQDISIKNIFLSLRCLSPFLFLFILFFSSYFYEFKIQFLTENKALNFILFILYLNFLFQFFGLLITKNSISNSYYLFVSLLSIVSAANLYNRDLNKVNYLFFITVLTLVMIVLGYLSYEWFLKTRSINMYGTYPDVFNYLADFSSNVIRSSGQSRSTMIIIIPLFYLILLDKIKLFYFIPYSRLLYLIPYLLLSSIIYFCQSRIVVLFFILFSFFSILYFLWNKTKKYKLQKVFILVVLPIIFLNSLIIIKEEVHSKFYSNKTVKFIVDVYYDNFKPSPNNLEQLHERGLAIPHYEKTYFEVDEANKDNNPLLRKPLTKYTKTYSTENSGVQNFIATRRYSFWKEVILKSKKPIIGYGALGDRFLINENSSNTLVYSYASGGIISTILMLIIIIRYSYLCFFLIFIKKIPLEKKNIFIFSSIFTVSFLLFRGIAEVGIAVFSIDFLVFLSCITICEKFKIQK